jgi:hypothetical protein
MAKGIYTPINPHKYLGDPSKIRFLSAWERRFQVFCDTNESVLGWASEEIKIPYYNPFKKKVCSYIPDFLVKYKDAQGNLKTEIVEIKPIKETVIRNKMTTYDQVCLVTNVAKWQATKAFCDKYGVVFRIMTEAGSFSVDNTGKAIPLTEQGLFKK